MRADHNHPRVRECARIVALNPGLRRAEIAHRMGIQPRTAGAYLWWASEMNWVHCTGKGCHAAWHAVPKKRELPVPGRRVVSVWAIGAIA